MFTGKLGELEQTLKILPGIGAKSAQRLAMFLVGQKKENSLHLAKIIEETVTVYRRCNKCNMLTEFATCTYCMDSTRNDNILCVVETSQDVFLLENTHEYKGRYFVLGALLSPIQGIGIDDIGFDKLVKLISDQKISELILALNPSAEGETTISFLTTKLQNYVPKITRLSTGIPFGSDIEYTNSLTLSEALKRRYTID